MFEPLAVEIEATAPSVHVGALVVALQRETAQRKSWLGLGDEQARERVPSICPISSMFPTAGPGPTAFAVTPDSFPGPHPVTNPPKTTWPGPSLVDLHVNDLAWATSLATS